MYRPETWVTLFIADNRSEKGAIVSWKESDRVSERLEFVKLAGVEGANIAAFCRRFGVSRKTGYKWLQRFNDDGRLGCRIRAASQRAHQVKLAMRSRK